MVFLLGLDQVSAFVTAATRAQAGTVRREVLECSEELGRAVAASSQDPIREAFRECFEGQLIPRIQVELVASEHVASIPPLLDMWDSTGHPLFGHPLFGWNADVPLYLV